MLQSEKTCTVLVVDDEPVVRKLAVAVLEGKGYHVQTASDGQEAVEFFERRPDAVELLLTDLAMPRKNGVELIREVKAIKPELHIVVMSGNLSQWENELDGIPCIRKPFAILTLLGVIEEQLKA